MMSCHTKFGHKRFSGSEGIVHADKDQTHRHMGMVTGGGGGGGGGIFLILFF